MSKKTAIYIDYDNISILLEKNYEKVNVSYKTKIIEKIKQKFNDENILLIKAFCDFGKVKVDLTELQKNQVELRHVYSSNSHTLNRKNASDIALAIDVIKSVYSKNYIEKYVLVSADSDMLPIVNELRYFDKEVAIVYSAYGSLKDYEDLIDKKNSCTIEQLLGLNEYKPLTEKEIFSKKELTHILEIINRGIIEVYEQYHKKGTSSLKDIGRFLWNSNDYVNQDISFIIECLRKSNILVEIPIANTPHKKILINEHYVKKEGIPLSDILTEKDF